MPKNSKKKTGKSASTRRVAKSPGTTASKPRTTARKPVAAKPAAGRKNSPQATMPALTEGSAAPAFRLPRDGGQTVALSDFKGEKLVLFFYPRADTPGCTLEAVDFTRLAKNFAAIGTHVLGVSADPVKKQESFRNKHQLGVPLLSDETQTMLNDYGVWAEKSMYGKVFMGIVQTTVLIGRDGKVARVWRNVRVDGHADEVLAAARAL